MTGSQEPRIRIEPKWITTDGSSAAMLMAEYGNKLDDWQKLVVDCWLGKDINGNYCTMSSGLAVPRQNGKNVCLEAREYYGLLINGEKILHTAHQVKTSKKAFRRFEAFFTDKRHPEILAEVKNIRYTNGEECIELVNGGRIEYSTRSRQAARGFDGVSLVVYDEAQELTDEQLEATMATLAASSTGTRQIIYAGTPPYPGCPGTVFGRVRNGILDKAGAFDSWHEWSAEGKSIEEININDKKIWYLTNPALGIHLSEDFTANEMTTMSPDGFARERLGWWTPETNEKINYAIDSAKWELCSSNKLKPEGKTAYGIKFSADGSEVCLCGAVISQNGDIRISEIDRKNTGHGIRWLSEWLNERYSKASCVVIDGKNGADLLIDRISTVWKMKNSIIRPNAKDIIAAASLLIDAVNENKLTWYELQTDLNDSATTSVKRPIAGGFGFGGENSIPIEACALALYGAKTSKRNPSKKMRIG